MNKLNITPAAMQAFVAGDMANFMAAATPGGIEAQEMQGQLEQSLLETLPRDLHRQDHFFEEVGFEFLPMNLKGNDELFQFIKFPTGWTKRIIEDDHFNTELLDQHGRVRGRIFYKAAFYDRKASAHLIPRFSIEHDYSDEWYRRPDRHCRVFINDQLGQVTMQAIYVQPEPHSWAPKTDAVKKLSDWLDQNYPDWKRPSSYWGS